MKRTRMYLWLFPVALLQVLLFACSSDNEGETPSDNFDVRFTLPASLDATVGGLCIFPVEGGGKSPLTSDSFILETETGVSYLCPIIESSSGSFTIRLAKECVTGRYNVYIKRGSRKKSFGKIHINIVEDIGFQPDAGATVYGIVSSLDGERVSNVVVSDGIEVAVTDEQGIYQLQSAKKWGYVFISIPSGYEVPSSGVLPLFHYDLKGDPKTVERIDFQLTKVDQSTYKVFMLGDMHLADRTGDIAQFNTFATDLRSYISQHSGQRMYAITLGDMTWDLYWYSHMYFCFPEYLEIVNGQFKGLQFFHTMGNHDNDYKTTSDFAAAAQYVRNIAPTYYSFNIGNVHYIVLDDINCDTYDGTNTRIYTKTLSSEQLRWLAKDLSYVDKATPLVITMHAQLFYPLTSTSKFQYDSDAANTEALLDLLDGYETHFVTGHTHMMFNVTPQDDIAGGQDVYEHNSGSVCASWWWSGHLTPGVHLGQDGTPGGYAVWDVSGTTFKWLYKSTGWPEDYQFRSYDLNRISFSTADIPKCPASVRGKFAKYALAYPANSRNEVLINVWNWNRNWKISVVDENGKKLTCTPVWAYDPLHIAGLTIPRFNDSTITSEPNFTTWNFTHFFKVTADDADVDLTITVEDEFGHIWTECMERPKLFSVDAYKNK